MSGLIVWKVPENTTQSYRAERETGAMTHGIAARWAKFFQICRICKTDLLFLRKRYNFPTHEGEACEICFQIYYARVSVGTCVASLPFLFMEVIDFEDFKEEPMSSFMANINATNTR